VEGNSSRLYRDRILNLQCASTPPLLQLLIIIIIIVIIIIKNSRGIMWAGRETHIRCRRIHKKFGRKTCKKERLGRPWLRCSRITKKWNVKMLAGLILPRIGISDGHLWTRKWNLAFHKATLLQWVTVVNYFYFFF